MLEKEQSLIAKENKILVILAHPDPENSLANAAMLQAIENLEQVTIHDLYASYPDFFIDISKEHELLLAHDVIVFQHPLFMYSCPALLKEWMDTVLGKGFAFGENSALGGKIWRTVVSAAGSEQAFSSQGYNQHDLKEILLPFELTAKLCKMKWYPPLILYWARNISHIERVEHAQGYRQWLIEMIQAPSNQADKESYNGDK